MLTFDFYTNTYGGLELPEEEFEKLAKRAERKIRAVTGLSQSAWVNLPEPLKEPVKQAVCAQIEYLSARGVESALGVTSVSQARIGNFSYTDGKTVTAEAGLGLTGVAPEVVDYLAPTGLLYKGVRTVD